MPGGDGTGPMGQGPFSGRGLGNCLAYGIPAIAGAVAAFGFGRRRGFGRGFGRSMGAGFARGFGFGAPSKEDQLNALKEEARYIQDRIDDLEKE